MDAHWTEIFWIPLFCFAILSLSDGYLELICSLCIHLLWPTVHLHLHWSTDHSVHWCWLSGEKHSSLIHWTQLNSVSVLSTLIWFPPRKKGFKHIYKDEGRGDWELRQIRWQTYVDKCHQCVMACVPCVQWGWKYCLLTTIHLSDLLTVCSLVTQWPRWLMVVWAACLCTTLLLYRHWFCHICCLLSHCCSQLSLSHPVSLVSLLLHPDVSLVGLGGQQVMTVVLAVDCSHVNFRSDSLCVATNTLWKEQFAGILLQNRPLIYPQQKCVTCLPAGTYVLCSFLFYFKYTDLAFPVNKRNVSVTSVNVCKTGT